MAEISKENVEKMQELKEKLLGQGYDVDKRAKERLEKIGMDPAVNESSILFHTAETWKISQGQAILLYNTIGDIKGLILANFLRHRLINKEISYQDLFNQLEKHKKYLDRVEELEYSYFSNYEKILGGDLFPIENSLLRKQNESIEKELVSKRKNEPFNRYCYNAIGATIYYGMMIDLQEPARDEYNKDLGKSNNKNNENDIER